mmetsp:Transcript_106450/g.227316  ORF Transcript_106450/g.227316 Transcript_106450/m.227316 type:complete len:205 (+) Transcript_106450:2477-3091(+)
MRLDVLLLALLLLSLLLGIPRLLLIVLLLLLVLTVPELVVQLPPCVQVDIAALPVEVLLIVLLRWLLAVFGLLLWLCLGFDVEVETHLSGCVLFSVLWRFRWLFLSVLLLALCALELRVVLDLIGDIAATVALPHARATRPLSLGTRTILVAGLLLTFGAQAVLEDEADKAQQAHGDPCSRQGRVQTAKQEGPAQVASLPHKGG